MTSYTPRFTARGKGKTKSARKQQHRQVVAEATRSAPTAEEQIRVPKSPLDNGPLIPKTANQKKFAYSVRNKTVTFGIGIFGVGKTYLSVKLACELYHAEKIDRMIFSRTALGAQEELGFYTGDEKEKFANWIKPIRIFLDRILGATTVDFLVKREIITFQPFATMRGHDWPRSFIMVDEAQNTTPAQMKLLLSRAGEESKIVCVGDPADQKDITGWSGIEDALEVLEGDPDVGVVRFGIDDIVRSGFVKRLAVAYQARDRRRNQSKELVPCDLSKSN